MFIVISQRSQVSMDSADLKSLLTKKLTIPLTNFSRQTTVIFITMLYLCIGISYLINVTFLILSFTVLNISRLINCKKGYK